MITRKTMALAALVAAAATLASPASAQDERTTCASRPNRLQLLCNGDGCIRLEIARICEALRRAPLNRAKPIQTSSRTEPKYRDLEQLIASID